MHSMTMFGKAHPLRQVFSVFALVLMYFQVVQSFVEPTHPVRISDQKPKSIQLWASEVTGSAEKPQRDPSEFLDRRSLLVAGALSLTATAGYSSQDRKVPIAPTSTSESMIQSPKTTIASSANEALTWIESMADKRFLHAVVASDYQFLYQPMESFDLASIDAESIFSEKVASSENGSRSVLMAASGTLANTNGVSVWPLETPTCSLATCKSIHYAWPEDQGVIFANEKLIVDGIDCGKMALEDALEGDMQVLVQSPSVLLVPKSMERSLRKGLKDAFLI